MKTSVVWADGTFESNTAPLMGSLEQCAVRAAELGFDGMSLTVNRPEELDPARIHKIMGACGLPVWPPAELILWTVWGSAWPKRKDGRPPWTVCCGIPSCAPS